MREIKSPAKLEWVDDETAIFLGGSIEMGTAEDWQTRLVHELEGRNVVLLNPRREQWDASWEQSINNPLFKEQVTWELDALDKADLVVFYFDPNTKSPITLMELGLIASYHNAIVCCPDGFWRKGNVEIVCERFEIELVHTFTELVAAIKRT
jgi:hypothetical protein